MKWTGFLTPLFFLLFLSCKKEEKNSLEEIRKNAITGTWKQKDVILAFPIPFAGQTLPVGFSLYDVAGMLPISGPGLICSQENIYTFNANFGFTIDGCTDLIFPGAPNSGNWKLDLNGGILQLPGTGGRMMPYLLGNITAQQWVVNNTVFIAEANADVPIQIILEKQ